ncbi:MAG: helix-turn-helix transcriptional regulator [Candidatus Neomarinimicrobiota bacterium]
MLEHIKIFISVLFILAGTGIVFLIGQRAQKYPYPYIKSLFHYCIVLILVFLSLFISKYLNINFSEIQTLRNAWIYRDLGILVFTLIELWLIVFLTRTALQMLEIPCSQQVLPIALGASILLVISYILKVWIGQTGPFFALLHAIHNFLWNNLIVLELPILIGLLIANRKTADRSQRRIFNIFGLWFIARYPLLLISMGLLYRFNQSIILQLSLTIFFFLMFIGTPLGWIELMFKPYAQSLIKTAEKRPGFEALLEHYKISGREKEIIVLILNGDSNYVIARKLFIALPTVKNHIYNIYQKLELSSRYQLMQLFSNDGSL